MKYLAALIVLGISVTSCVHPPLVIEAPLKGAACAQDIQEILPCEKEGSDS